MTTWDWKTSDRAPTAQNRTSDQFHVTHVYECRVVCPVGDTNDVTLGTPSGYWTGTVKGEGRRLQTWRTWSKISNALKRLGFRSRNFSHSCFLKPQEHVQSEF